MTQSRITMIGKELCSSIRFVIISQVLLRLNYQCKYIKQKITFSIYVLILQLIKVRQINTNETKKEFVWNID